jgi:hypothetical protein
MFIVYQQAHRYETLATQVWNYFESDIFKGLTVSLLFPILIFLLERRFRIIEKLEDERKERQLHAIDVSVQKWNDFYNLTNEIIYYRNNGDKVIPDILRRLDDTKSRTIDIINSWKSRFKYMKAEDMDIIVFFETILYFAAKTVANLIEKERDETEITKLQDALIVIQQVLGNYGHYYGLKMLDSFTRLEEVGISNKERQIILADVENSRHALRNYAKYLSSCERKDNLDFTLVRAPETKEFLDDMVLVQEWLLKNPNVQIGSNEFNEYVKSENLTQLFNRYRKIAFESRAKVTRTPYSKSYLISLADIMSFSTLLGSLRNRTKYA